MEAGTSSEFTFDVIRGQRNNISVVYLCKNLKKMVRKCTKMCISIRSCANYTIVAKDNKYDGDLNSRQL